MIWFKLPWRITLVSAICLALNSLFVNQALAQERSNSSTEQTQQPANQQPPRRQQAATSRFVLPPLADRSAPGNREGAASRGTCPAIDTPLTALVPAFKPTSDRIGGGESVWSLTASVRPTFWFYVPYSTSSVRSAEFVLQDREDNDVYSTVVKLPDRPGVVSLSLPSTAHPLESGKMYHWFFKVSCTPQNASSPVFVEGWVERVIPNSALARQLEAAVTPQQRIAVYAANGIWHDALTTVGELRLDNPANIALKADWNNLLQSVDLANIAAQPILPCCTSTLEQVSR